MFNWKNYLDLVFVLSPVAYIVTFLRKHVYMAKTWLMTLWNFLWFRGLSDFHFNLSDLEMTESAYVIFVYMYSDNFGKIACVWHNCNVINFWVTASYTV